jgi:hypothetical protein
MTDLFEDLQKCFHRAGPNAAIDGLCAALQERQDFTGLFYALLLRKRFELGVSPIPTGPSSALPPEVHAEYENAIRIAASKVGKLCLDAGRIPEAWPYFRMLDDPDPVKLALEKVVPADAENCQPLIDIAYHQGVHPTKGFDLVLERSGLCSAITLVGGHEFAHGQQVRDYCIKRLVRALHAELIQRLIAHIEYVQHTKPAAGSVPELLAGRDWLFEDDLYDIDLTHLASVVQMSIHLPRSEELDLARELCIYGEHISPRMRYNSEPPFEDQYRDYGIYLAILAGENVEQGLAHFHGKVDDSKADEVGTYPAEVLVNLLLKLGRARDALAVARRHLAKADPRQLSCPGVVELCDQAGDYESLAAIAREQDNAVYFVAGLLAAARH